MAASMVTFLTQGDIVDALVCAFKAVTHTGDETPAAVSVLISAGRRKDQEVALRTQQERGLPAPPNMRDNSGDWNLATFARSACPAVCKALLCAAWASLLPSSPAPTYLLSTPSPWPGPWPCPAP